MKLLEISKLILVLTIVASGIFVGIGITTFTYAKGASYFSTDPVACKNCHVMNDVFERWSKGGHQHVATCVDCHLPHDSVISKYMVKAENGFFHSLMFTLGTFPQYIRARESSKEVVQHNCEHCHSTMAIHPKYGGDQGKESLRCVSCHRYVGHDG